MTAISGRWRDRAARGMQQPLECAHRDRAAGSANRRPDCPRRRHAGADHRCQHQRQHLRQSLRWRRRQHSRHVAEAVASRLREGPATRQLPARLRRARPERPVGHGQAGRREASRHAVRHRSLGVGAHRPGRRGRAHAEGHHRPRLPIWPTCPRPRTTRSAATACPTAPARSSSPTTVRTSRSRPPRWTTC